MTTEMKLKPKVESEITETCSKDSIYRGVGNLWSSLNHVAIVVADVGRSLQFYTDVVGMKQVIRPDFDRHGAWLTFNNVDLHLLKGLPAVHADGDLIVSHLAIDVSDMTALRKRLASLGIEFRKNMSVPNPREGRRGVVDQAFVRDPDGYYVEFCNCENLHQYLTELEREGRQLFLDLGALTFTRKYGDVLLKKASSSRNTLRKLDEVLITPQNELEAQNKKEHSEYIEEGVEIDEKKLQNLIKRREIYGDVTQNATEEELMNLMRKYKNDVSSVILDLMIKVRQKGAATLIPPAFYERDGSFYQPTEIEISNDEMSRLKLDA